MKCLIVDDEYLALQLLENYVSKIPSLQLVGKCNNALQTLEVLRKQTVDLLFLDIQMPDLTGLELLKTLPNPPMVIFTTAYSEYALEGYELNVLDYLLKPIAFERFVKAINKAEELFTLQNKEISIQNLNLLKPASKDYIMVKADYKNLKVRFEDILYVEGLKEYVSIYTTTGKRIVTHSTMKNMEHILPSDQFMRIHKSYIISLPKVEAIVGNMLEINKQDIPIGRSYRTKVFGYFTG
ncbi:MAG: LytR/AlgR family response regulator transcription factor [Chitinophagales bacterium]